MRIGGAIIRGMPTWNLDATVSKDIGIWKEGQVGATIIFQFTNVLNHVQLGDPDLDISYPAGFGAFLRRAVQHTAPNGVRSPHSLLIGSGSSSLHGAGHVRPLFFVPPSNPATSLS